MNIGIVGAGLLGQLTALALCKTGHQISIFDPDIPPGKSSCSRVAAGMLTPYAELETTEPIVLAMAKDSLSRWQHILKQLNKPVYFQQTGSLLIAHRQDQHELTRFKQCFQQKTDSLDGIDPLDQHALAEKEPALAQRFSQGLYLKQEGQIAANELLDALQATLTEKGVNWHQATVTHIKPYQLQTQTEQYTFDWVIDCRGLGAKADYPGLRGVRGELLWLHAPEVKFKHLIRLMHPRYAIYLVPRPEGRYIIGASTIESEDTSPISVQTTLELLSAAYSLHPGFAHARLIHTATHCRPAFANNLPKIIHQPGLIAANGLYRHGYLLCPILSDIIAQIAQGKADNLPAPARSLITQATSI